MSISDVASSKSSKSSSSLSVMADQTDFRFPATPGMPLFSLSPERVNKQRLNLMQSPSLPILPGYHELNHAHFLADSEYSRQNEDAAFRVPGSPSRRENGSPLEKNDASGFSPPKHWRTNSDVQGIVARFNGLEIKDRLEDKIKKSEASLKRMQMGREEAEAQVKELREEGRTLKKDLDESKDRERRVTKRLDVVMEDLHRSKETQVHAQSLYEKEIRRARKEAFKSSSILVKLQEELKAARATLKVLHSDLDLERIKVSKREQETFNAQYQLVGVEEELSRAQSRIKVVEEERDALKTNLKEEEVARVAAEGRIALPPAAAEDDEFASPKKPRQKPMLRSQSPEKEPPRIILELEQLRAELEEYRCIKEQAEEQVEFMRLECQFGCCSCRVAERQHETYMHDLTFEDEVRNFKPEFRALLTPPESMILDEKDHHSLHGSGNTTLNERPLTPVAYDNDTSAQKEDAIVLSTRETFHPVSSHDNLNRHIEKEHPVVDPEQAILEETTVPLTSEAEHPVYIKQEPDVEEMQTRRKSFALVARIKRATSALIHHEAVAQLDVQSHEAEAASDENIAEDTITLTQRHQHFTQEIEEIPIPSTPHTNTNIWHTSTTTTKIPLVDPATPNPKYSAFDSPNITKEEAIQRLRERRGRARSEARTPKKGGDVALTPRRDISAPEVRGKATPGSVVRGRLVH